MVSGRSDRLKRAFGERLKCARTEAGFASGTKFAAAIGVEAAGYRKYERGEAVPPIDVLADIVRLTGVDLNWLLLGHPR